MTALRPTDRLDLADLVHRYAAAVDERDPAAVAALFTPDGVLASPRPPRHLDPHEEATGPAAIEAAMGALSGLVLTRHAVVGVVLTAAPPDGADGADAADRADAATGRVACTAHHLLPDGTDLVWHLTYRDRYRRTGAGWRFTRRDLHVDVVEKRAVVAARGLQGGTA